MTDRLDEQVELVLDEIAVAVADGVDVEDIPLLVSKSMEVAERLGDVPGHEKAQFAEAFASALFDRFFSSCTPRLAELIEELDVPLLPEWAERITVDPILKAWAPSLLRAALRRALPSLFTLVVDATRGNLAINNGSAGPDLESPKEATP